jgi:hypothetical protein
MTATAAHKIVLGRPLYRTKDGFLPGLTAEDFETATECVYALVEEPVEDAWAVKLGKTAGGRHPEQRRAHLSTGNPRPLILLAYDLCISEAQAHRDLDRYRIREPGEWFYLLPAVRDYLRIFSWLDLAAYAQLRLLGTGGNNG